VTPDDVLRFVIITAVVVVPVLARLTLKRIVESIARLQKVLSESSSSLPSGTLTDEVRALRSET
jgi:hypothetical protein